MQLQVIKEEGLVRVISLTLPAAKLEESVNRRIAQLKQQISLAGFRKGKVPADLIRRQYGRTLLNEAGSDLMRDSFLKTAVEREIKLAGIRAMEPKQLAFGKDFIFEVSYEIFPKLRLYESADATVERITATVTDQDVIDMMERLRWKRATLADAAKAAGSDDVVTIDYEMEVLGEKEATKEKRSNVQVDLSAQWRIPRIVSALIGMKAGETKSVKDELPKGEREGKDGDAKKSYVIFHITVKKVQHRVLPELNESFLRQYGIDGTESDFRAQIKRNMTLELNTALRSLLKERTYEVILASHKEFKVPETQVENEAARLRGLVMQQVVQQTSGKKVPEKEDLPLNMFRGRAERNVKVSLLLVELVKKNDIKVEDGQLEERIQEIASTYQDPARVRDHYSKDEKLRERIRNDLMEERAVECYLEKIKVTEKQLSYKEVMTLINKNPDVA